MKSLLHSRLRVIIPTIVFFFFILVTVLFEVKQYKDTKEYALTTLKTSLNIQMYKLQNSISDLLILNKEGLAERQLTEVVLDPNVKILIVSDENGIVRFANFREWIGMPINKINDFDYSFAKIAIKKSKGLILSKNDSSFKGYYSIYWGLKHGELREERIGCIYFVYDYSTIVKQVKYAEIQKSIVYGIISLVLSILLSIVLFKKITKRVERINSAMNNFAEGDLTVRLSVNGFDEIDSIATGFNSMVGHIEKERESLLLMQFIVERSSDPIYLITKDGSFAFVNEAAYSFLGYTHDELLQLKVSDINAQITPEHWSKHWIYLQQVGCLKYESKHITKYKEEIDVEVSSNYFNFGNKQYDCTIVRDITERKHAEEELKKQNEEIITLNEEYKLQNEELVLAKEKAEESDKFKTAFLQNMSHEIRTPMNAIMGFSDLLNDNELSIVKRENFISIINNSCTQLMSIVSDILTIASIETKQEKINNQSVIVNDVLDELHSIFIGQASKKQIFLVLKYQLSTVDSIILTDKTKLIQILTNLLTNALKFTDRGFIEFGYVLKDFTLEFYVKDSGIGIKKELHNTIFERFKQADIDTSKKYGGTGLGLTISKAFVELLGGTIWIESEIGNGANFKFTIPYKPVNKMDVQISTQIKNERNIAVLVAEDEGYNSQLISEFLKKSNFTIFNAKDGLEAINLCKMHPEIELILMDIKMPELDGISATAVIKEFRPNVKIIAQTAYALEDEIAKFKSQGFDDYVTKPIRKNALFDVLNRCIM